jgi:hypothetical protein
MKEEFDNELRELSPLLADLKKREAGEAFKVPKYYFDNLTDKVLAEAKTTEKTVFETAKQAPQYPTIFTRLQSYLSLVFQPKYAFALASFALVMAAGWYTFKPKAIDNQAVVAQATPNESPQATEMPLVDAPSMAKINESPKSIAVPDNKLVLSDVPKAEIESYIKDNLGAFDDNLIGDGASKLADAGIKKENTEGSHPTHPQSGLTEEELELYLNDTFEDILDDGSDNNL